MNKFGLAAIVAGAVVVAAVAFVITLLLIKLLWAWTIPDLFPGAVVQGLVADRIGWLTAAKVALFIAVLAGFARGSAHATVNSKG